MCPLVARKLAELSLSVFDCYSNSKYSKDNYILGHSKILGRQHYSMIGPSFFKSLNPSPLTACLLLSFTGSVIVHQAWDEADSEFPGGRSSADSLQRSGLELEISLSDELSEESDPSLLAELASLAVCNGFDYVKINGANGTVSVAMMQCTAENIRYTKVYIFSSPSLLFFPSP